MNTIPLNFLAAFYAVEAAFPDWKVKPSGNGIPGTVDVYYQSIADLELDDVIAAMGRAVQNGDFAPRIAELREAAISAATARETRRAELLNARETADEDERLTASWAATGGKPNLSQRFADILKRANPS